MRVERMRQAILQDIKFEFATLRPFGDMSRSAGYQGGVRPAGAPATSPTRGPGRGAPSHLPPGRGAPAHLPPGRGGHLPPGARGAPGRGRGPGRGRPMPMGKCLLYGVSEGLTASYF